MAAEGDTSALHHCARGLAVLQARWGAFATIKGAGTAAAAVADIVQRMRRELGPDAPPVGDASHLLQTLCMHAHTWTSSMWSSSSQSALASSAVPQLQGSS